MTTKRPHNTVSSLVDPDPISIVLGVIGAIGSIGWIYDKTRDAHDRRAARRDARDRARSTVRSIRHECRTLSEACEDLILILRDAEIEGTSAINKIFRLGNTKIYLNRQRMGEVAVIAAQVGGAFGKLHSQIRSLLTLEPDVAAEAHTRLIELNVDVSTTLNSIIYGEMTNDEALSSLLDLIRKIEQAFDFSELDDENF